MFASGMQGFYLLSLADRTVRPILQSQFRIGWPALSRDGRWLAYASDETGRTEVYVQPYPGLGARTQISAEGGREPAWSPDGRELFYTVRTNGPGLKMMAVSVVTQPAFAAGAPRLLFEGGFGAALPVRDYDISPDGRRFLMVRLDEQRPVAQSTDMVLVQNWAEELKNRVPAGSK